MHILFIPKWYPRRSDPQLGDFIRKQAIAVGGVARVSVLCVSPDPDLKRPGSHEVNEADGIWELRCYYRSSTNSNSFIRKAVNFRRYWRTSMRGIAHVIEQRGKPDIAHAHILVRPVMVALALRRKHGIPMVISEQSSEYLDGAYASKGSLFKRLNHYLFSKASAVTAVSTWLGDSLVGHGLVRRYDVVPNVIPGLDRALPAAGDPRHFMVVADLVDKTKNVSGVIKAMSKASKADPALRLSIIGDGPDRKMLQDLAHDQGLNGNVDFLGRLTNKEVLDHMTHTGSVIINSNVETFSVVTGEALALGKPVIATRCGGPIAFVTPENGILIERQDDEALKEAMLQIVRSAGERSPQIIRNSVSERFSYEVVGKAFLQIYERVLEHGP